MSNKKLNQKKIYTSETEMGINYIKIILIILVIVCVFSLITSFVTNKKNNKTNSNEVTIQYKEIIAGNILNVSNDEYYVLLEFENDNYNTLYETYLTNYASKEKALPFFGKAFSFAVFINLRHLKITNIACDSLFNDFLCLVNTVSFGYRSNLASLKCFVNLEKVLNFFKIVFRKFADVAVAIVVGVVNGNCNNFFVTAVVINHIENADRLAFNERHRLNCFTAQNKNIKRIAVICKGSRNKAVVGRIVS